MPTIIVLDTSGSMNIPPAKSADTFTPMQFAYSGLHSFLDTIATTSKMEFVSLATFTTQFEVIAPFTRDVELLKRKLMQINLSDEFDVKKIMEGLHTYAVEEWGSGISCNVIMVAQDKYALESCAMARSMFPGNLIICNLGPELFRPDFIPTSDDCSCVSEFYQPELPINLMTVQQMFLSVAEKYYSTWVGQLICGNFNSKITLSPSPEPYYLSTDFESALYTVEGVLEICGFIELQHLGSPGAVSRHLVLPYTSPSVYPVISRQHSKPSPDSDEDSQEEGQIPSFCVLLHGALKVENMAALCCVGNDWYGVLFSWADSKKKSNLMLSLLEPGCTEAVPWLGDLNKLAINPGPQETIPVKTTEKKSYTQNCVAWIQQQGLQSDIQKILRHSRKLPEKTQQFYKELNRVRRAAIGLGFMSLIEGLAAVLERECTLLPGGAHPACALQLTHAAGVLREPHARDHKYNIAPLKTSFQAESGFDLF